MLIQAFSKAGATQEVSLLAQFTAYTYEIADKAVMWEYLSCWLSHYRGRGIPGPILARDKRRRTRDTRRWCMQPSIQAEQATAAKQHVKRVLEAERTHGMRRR